MPKVVYTNLSDLNKLQTDIMIFVDLWVHEKKTPVPYKEIITEMTRQGVILPTIIKALGSLLRKKYIRRAVVTSNKSFFVQLRRV